MKRVWKGLRPNHPDEMEKAILFRAQRNAYFFLIAALLAWSLYESSQVYLRHTALNLLPCLLLVTAAVIQALSQSILTRNAVKDDEDSYETGPLQKLVLWGCVAASLAATIVAAFLFMGARL